MLRPLRVAIWGIVFSALSTAAQTASFSVNPFADALVTTGPGGSLSGNNYGAAGGLAVSANGLPRGEFLTVMQFDLLSARNAFDSQYGVGGWTIHSMTLRLTATANNNPGFFNTTAAGQIGVSLLRNNSWLEGTGVPNTPTLDGVSYTSLQTTFLDPLHDEALGVFGFNGGSSGATDFLLNLSPGLFAGMQSGGPITLQLIAADSSVSYLFNSRSIATAGNRPILTVVVVPEPASGAMLGLGMAGLLWRHANNRRR